ncbi:hypothetical protein [[Mycobacterium] vasticus]|uniref:Low molecular weight antigen MTB12-like C-terminal domain-containing protein n=1 Tax=[Mycobacterium] vasticus TaxID=2875777 RepID=A0ABU5YTN0_9MYCO|nr:hypothetical protein [Mycolicibacter sp. MYC017]MEB3068270.1 hypothetical protein [Mycolicibacter sp. MYC017]
MRVKPFGVAVLATAVTLVAALCGGAAAVTTAAPAYADCGDPGQPACTGPVPTVDEVVAIMDKLTDSDIPAATKSDIVTPGFTPEEAGTIDDHLNRMNADGLLPLNFVVTDIQPAPANLAGATVTSVGSFHQRSAHEPVVLADQDGHWLITHDTAMTVLDNFWYNANRRFPVVGGI